MKIKCKLEQRTNKRPKISIPCSPVGAKSLRLGPHSRCKNRNTNKIRPRSVGGPWASNAECSTKSNACGLYKKLRGASRPVDMRKRKKDTVQPRKRSAVEM